MYTVGLVDLGENLSIRLRRFARKLNSLQSSFQFEIACSVPNIGPPDVDDRWYDFNGLFECLRKVKSYSRVDFLVGITHVSVTNAEESKGRTERDYFSLSDHEKVSVVTERMSRFNSRYKSKQQYLAYLIMEALLINISKQDLGHTAIRNCLFDDCEERAHFAVTIEHGKICRVCEGKLADVEDAVIRDVHAVLHWCKRNGALMSLKETFENPLSTLVVGTSLGWFMSGFVHDRYYIPVAVLTFLVFALVFMHTRYLAR